MKSWKLNNGYKIFKIAEKRSNAYLIETKNGKLLIDTGRKEFRKIFDKRVHDCNLDDDKIDFLILTHTHYDHCANAKLLRDQKNLKILASEKELEFIQKEFTPVSSGTTFLSKLLVSMSKPLSTKPFMYETFIVDIPFDNYMDMSNMGFDIEIIATPGHSIGSISIIVNKEIALTGDALFGIFKNSVLPPFANSIPELVHSWKKLLESGCHTFLPGHGSEIKRNILEKEYLKYAKKFNFNPS